MPRKKVTKDNRIQLPDGRFYESEGKKLPSVTTLINIISKPGLVYWAANEERTLVVETAVEFYREIAKNPSQGSCDEYRRQLEQRLGNKKAHEKLKQEAGDIGTHVHDVVEWELKNELGMISEFDPKPDIKSGPEEKAYNEWKRWRKDVKLKPIAIEQVIVSDKYGYAGTLDLLAEVEGLLTVPDWKTGKAIYPEAFLQNAAYRQAVREMGMGDPKKGIIVRLPKLEDDPGFEVADAGDEDFHFKVFLNTRELWNWQRESRRKTKTPDQAVLDL